VNRIWRAETKRAAPPPAAGARHRWLALLFVAALAGCASSDHRSSATQSSRHSHLIRQGDYGETWPFGPNKGLLRCRRAGSKRIVTLEVDDVNYALNEAARRRGAADPRLILATDHSGLPFDYSPVLEDGLRLCGNS
jgi:Protein of unknown function (DUF2511)